MTIELTFENLHLTRQQSHFMRVRYIYSQKSAPWSFYIVDLKAIQFFRISTLCANSATSCVYVCSFACKHRCVCVCARAAGASPSLKGSAALGHVMMYLHCSVLQCVAACCNVLQCVAVCVSMVETRHHVLLPRVCGRSGGFIVAKSNNISTLFVWEEMGDSIKPILRLCVLTTNKRACTHTHTSIHTTTQTYHHPHSNALTA